MLQPVSEVRWKLDPELQDSLDQLYKLCLRQVAWLHAEATRCDQKAIWVCGGNSVPAPSRRSHCRLMDSQHCQFWAVADHKGLQPINRPHIYFSFFRGKLLTTHSVPVRAAYRDITGTLKSHYTGHQLIVALLISTKSQNAARLWGSTAAKQLNHWRPGYPRI